jgi:small subunit ribosomal protein S6
LRGLIPWKELRVLRDYEILFIVRPDLDEDKLGEAVKTVDTLIANLGGKTRKSDVWGRRKLAFEVKHLREGQYVLTDFEIDPERVPELESTLAISESVFRHLVVRKPERTPAPSKRNRRGQKADAEAGADGVDAATAEAPAAATAEAPAAAAEAPAAAADVAAPVAEEAAEVDADDDAEEEGSDEEESAD